MAQRFERHTRFGLKSVVRRRRDVLSTSKHRSLILEVLEHRALLSGTPSATIELNPPGDSSLPAVTLALDSYQFSFQNPTSISGGPGIVSFNDLQVTAPLSGFSPQLFEALAGYDWSSLDEAVRKIGRASCRERV